MKKRCYNPFYITQGGHFYAGNRYYTERQWRDSYLLLYTIAGAGMLKYRGGEYLLKPNQVVLFNCYEYQFYKTADNDLWELKWIHFNGGAAKEYENIINKEALSVITIQESEHFEHFFDKMNKVVCNGDLMSDVKICNNMLSCLTQVIISKNSVANNKMYHKHKAEIDKVMKFVHANFEKKISIEDIASHVLMSKYYLVRIFKSYMGIGPYEYLINYRIDKAKSLLRQTNLSVGEVACNVGFGDTNNFIRYFKKVVGTTPLNFKKNWID